MDQKQMGLIVVVVIVAVAVVAAMTCFAAVVAAFVRTREQAIPVGLAVAFVLASFGGLFWPVYDLPRSVQAIGKVLINSRAPLTEKPSR